MPTKFYRIKMNDFWINVSYSPPHYPRQKQRNRNCQKWDIINAFKSQQVLFLKSHKLLPFHRTDFGHFNSNSIVRNQVHNRFTDPAIEFEWIAIEMSEVCAVEREQFLWFLKLDLLWFEGIYLFFGTFDFFVFDVGNEEDYS